MVGFNRELTSTEVDHASSWVQREQPLSSNEIHLGSRVGLTTRAPGSSTAPWSLLSVEAPESFAAQLADPSFG